MASVYKAIINTATSQTTVQANKVKDLCSEIADAITEEAHEAEVVYEIRGPLSRRALPPSES